MGRMAQRKKARQPQKNPARAGASGTRGYVSPSAPARLLKLLGKRHPAYCRTGLHDDSFFGNIKAKQYENGGFDPGTRMYRTALAKSPESHRMASFIGAVGTMQMRLLRGLRAVERLAELHFTSLSAVHGYQDYPEDETKTTMGRWKRQEITPELLAERGIPCDLAWFCNESGERVSRSVFAYVRDHLGLPASGKNAAAGGRLEAGCTDACCSDRF